MNNTTTATVVNNILARYTRRHRRCPSTPVTEDELALVRKIHPFAERSATGRINLYGTRRRRRQLMKEKIAERAEAAAWKRRLPEPPPATKKGGKDLTRTKAQLDAAQSAPRKRTRSRRRSPKPTT